MRLDFFPSRGITGPAAQSSLNRGWTLAADVHLRLSGARQLRSGSAARAADQIEGILNRNERLSNLLCISAASKDGLRSRSGMFQFGRW